MDFTPQVETAEITDADLDNVSGGLVGGVVGDTVGTVDGTLSQVDGTVGQVTGTVGQLTGVDATQVTGLAGL